MAQEIQTSAAPGLTLTAKLVQGATVIGNAIALTEVAGLAGYYTGSVPGGTAAGVYTVLIISAGTVIASGPLWWDGAAEVLPGAASVVAAIKAKTDNLPASPAGAGDVTSILQAVQALPSAATVAAAVHTDLQGGTPIPVAVTKVLGKTLAGSGTTADPFHVV